MISYRSASGAHRIRPLPILSFLLCALILAGCPGDTAEREESTYLFRNIDLVDAVHGHRSAQSVLVRGDRIVAAGATGQIDVPAGATVIDASGKTLIPGLWDAHVHLTNTAEMVPALFSLFLVNGITYVRDTSASLDPLRPIYESAGREAPNGMAPDITISGPHIEGTQISWASSVSSESVEEAGAHVEMLADAGVDEIKLYELLPREFFHEAVSRAADRGLPVSAHVPLTMDVVEASRAGLASMEHMQNLELSCSSDWESLLEQRREMIERGAHLSGNEMRRSIHEAQRLHAIETFDRERCEEVIRTLAENGTWQVPTLTITLLERHRLYERPEWRETFNYLPGPVRADWLERADAMAGASLYEDADAYGDWISEVIPALAEAGVGFMAGTDMPLVLLTPGFSLHRELELLVEAGLTPMQVIEAATLGPARYFGLHEEQGAISEGMRADLVLLDGNPLESISNTQRINAVMRNGRLHTRTDLDRMMERLESDDGTSAR